MSFRAPLQYTPIPGTEQPVRGLFVKRWGTLIASTQEGPCKRVEDVRFSSGAIDALFRASQAGWKIYLIGNEFDVAMGRLSDADWDAFQGELLAHLRSQGVLVERSYACLDHPEGLGAHRNKSVFQLPDTGVFYHAAQHDAVHLSKSWVVGNEVEELTAGERSGCRTAAVTAPLLGSGQVELEAEVRGESLREVLDLLASALTRMRA